MGATLLVKICRPRFWYFLGCFGAFEGPIRLLSPPPLYFEPGYRHQLNTKPQENKPARYKTKRQIHTRQAISE